MNIDIIKLLPLFAAAIIVPGAVINVQAQDMPKPEHAGKHHRGAGLKQLNLTPEQKVKMQQIRQENMSEMDKILTPEQKTKLQALKSDRKGMRHGLKELNLTPEQKAKMKAMRQAQREKFKAVLTPSQQSQLDKIKAERGKKFPGMEMKK